MLNVLFHVELCLHMEPILPDAWRNMPIRNRIVYDAFVINATGNNRCRGNSWCRSSSNRLTLLNDNYESSTTTNYYKEVDKDDGGGGIIVENNIHPHRCCCWIMMLSCCDQCSDGQQQSPSPMIVRKSNCCLYCCMQRVSNYCFGVDSELLSAESIYRRIKVKQVLFQS
jgi:hypothetical protein